MATTITVSYSELDAYRQCPLKHSLGYLNLWTKEAKEGSALSRGSAWHEILQTHYLTIRRMRTKDNGEWLYLPSSAKQREILMSARSAVAISGLIGDIRTGAQSEQQELLAWMYDGHCKQYGIDLDWRILGVERAGQTRLLTESGYPSRFILKYKIDLVIYDEATAQLKVVDHKSAADFSRKAEIDIDDQFGLYTWAYQRETGKRPASVVRSDARTRRNKGPMKLEDRFRRIPTHRNDAELNNIALDAYRTAKMAYGRGSLVHSSPAPDRCTWRCDFLEAHLAMRKGIAAPRTVLKDFGFFQREAKHQEYTKDEGQS
jgi:hypothetical protein